MQNFKHAVFVASGAVMPGMLKTDPHVKPDNSVHPEILI
jgi:hypothetical protein